MQFVLIISIGFFVVVAAFVAVFIGRWLFKPDELNPRLMTYVVEEESPSQRLSATLTSRTRELSGSLASRVLYPIFRRIGTIISRMTPVNSAEELRHQLYIAGTPSSLGPREFYGIRFALLLFGIWVAFLFLRREFTQINLLIAGMLIFMFMLLPVLWLRSRVTSQQNAIRKGFPDALDMLSVCADAGLGFDQSLQRVSEHWSTRIAAELGRVVSEMEMGLSRRDSLRNLALRLDITEISSFVAVIIQSDQLGMSISDTLHAQAEQMRVERQYRAQEAARKIPTKMLIPLAFLIFPALMAIIMGPAVPSLVELFSNF
jgi:tight adherence protein C